jgi:hypothetical protein
MKKTKAPTARRSSSPELRGDSSTSDLLQLKAQSTTDIDDGEAYVHISIYNISLYMCIYMYIYMYIYVCIIQRYIHTYIHTCIHIDIYRYILIWT